MTATTTTGNSRRFSSPAALTAAGLFSATAAWALWYQWRLIRRLRSDLDDREGSAEGGGEGGAEKQQRSLAYSDNLRANAEADCAARAPETRDGSRQRDDSAESLKADEGDGGTPPQSTPSLNVVPIGTLSSVFRLCVGTPRQGMLCPNSRGRIDLDRSILSPDSLDSLDRYGHVWIVFVFHLNTNAHRALVAPRSPPAVDDGAEGGEERSSAKRGRKKKKNGKGKGKGGGASGGGARKHAPFPSKVSPPALGGRRVGLFSTRTPHRPNPIGFTLCKLDGVEMGGSDKNKRGGVRFCVHVSGIDLVDGTPVLDIKPYVPHYDSVGYLQSDPSRLPEGVSLPDWVSTGLDKRRAVRFSPESLEQLTSIFTGEDNALEFYGPKCRTGRGPRGADDEEGETVEETLAAVRSCIEEVLAVDVRSSWQTDKARRGKFQAERAGRLRDASVVAADATNAGEGAAGEPPPPAVDEEGSGDRTAATPAGGGGGGGVSKDEERFCTQQIDNLLVHFTVAAPVGVGDGDGATGAAAGAGSGCDDAVEVRRIERIVRLRGGDGDDGASPPPPPSAGVDVDASDAGAATTGGGGGDAVPVARGGDGGKASEAPGPSSGDVEPDVALYDPADEEAALIHDPDFKRVSLKPVDADDASAQRPAPRVEPPSEFNALKRYWNNVVRKNTPQGVERDSRTEPFGEDDKLQQEEEGSVKVQELSTGSKDDADTKLNDSKVDPPSAAATDPLASKSIAEGEAFVLVESNDPEEAVLTKSFFEKGATTQSTQISAAKDKGDRVESLDDSQKLEK